LYFHKFYSVMARRHSYLFSSWKRGNFSLSESPTGPTCVIQGLSLRYHITKSSSHWLQC